MTGVVEGLVHASAELAALGLSPGSSGNASVRVGDVMHISPTGVSMGELDADDLARVSLADEDWGSHIGGPTPSKEFPLHLAMYARDPSGACVVHLHSTSSVAASCLEPWSEWSALPPLTPYFVMRVGQAPLIPYAPPGDAAQANAVRMMSEPFQGALLQNHGQIAAGPDVDTAVARAIEIEETARLRVALGEHSGVRTLSDAEARHLARHYGSPWRESADAA